MKILGLDKFGLKFTDVTALHADKIYHISIYLPYFPNIESLKPLSPKQRRLLICQYFRDQYKNLKNTFEYKDIQLIGSVVKPRGVRVKVKGSELFEISNQDFIENIFIDKIEGLDKIELPKREYFFSVQALFAAQVEGFDYSNSIRLTEDRILLVKAVGLEEATEKALKEFKSYSAVENLNTDYRFTRWEFVKIIDVFETDMEEIDPNGTEVFSAWKRKKLN